MKYEVAYDGSIPELIEADSEAEAREAYALAAESRGYDIERGYIEVL